ncbi:replication initiation protein, RepL2 [Streptomyces sp. NPDC095817]|uniref:replication initiation protein, RepL2 n=1 Tax=Streptomyces sp. NPDC095817 TaxID=3155082 RepID=UPI00331DC01B
MLYALHPTTGPALSWKRQPPCPSWPVWHLLSFLRTRKQIIEADWLGQTEKLRLIKYFRIDPRQLGENVIVPLRRAT